MDAPHVLFIPTRFTENVKKCSTSCHREGNQNLNRCLFSDWFRQKKIQQSVDSALLWVHSCRSSDGNLFPRSASLSNESFLHRREHFPSCGHVHRWPATPNQWSIYALYITLRLISSTCSLLIKVHTYKKCWFLNLVSNSSKTGDLSLFFLKVPSLSQLVNCDNLTLYYSLFDVNKVLKV